MKLKWNMNVRDLTTIGICIAIAVVLGKSLGFLHGVMPFSRGIINAPFYSFLIAVMLYRIRKPGTMALFGIGYGLIMIHISIFMSIAVIIGGLLGDIVLLLIVRKFDSNIKIALCAPIYSVGGIIGTFIVVTFFIDSPRYIFEGPLTLALSILTVYLTGLLGSFTTMKIMPSRLRGLTHA